MKGKASADTIGPFIKKRVIPAGMTVIEAARRLGVSRPALSNLLNGKALLSNEMALRLEKTFGADRSDLLARQAALERDRLRDADGAVAAGRFVPPFLAVKARDIEAWAADRTETRQQLAVLLRTLVHSTGDGLRRVDFPGGDNAQRPGWDGWVETRAATPWVPQGKSGWEFGVSTEPRRKADRDFAQRLKSTSVDERAELAFVFVTPRNWPGKKEWAKEKAATGEWKAVRAFDADDLEQWLEQSIAGQIWLADQLGFPTQGCTPLDRFWEKWRNVCDPPITERMFAPAVEMHLDAFKGEIATPGGRPLTVAADSTGEALALVACMFRRADIPPETRDRAVVIDSVETMRTLAQSTSPFISIVRHDEVERELGPVCGRFPCIAVRPRNATEEPAIVGQMLSYEQFHDALSDMGLDRDRSVGLEHESGRSPTILRRRLSPIQAIKTPPWAADRDVARSLIPMVLAGVWSKGFGADCEVLSELSGSPYDEMERQVARLHTLDDPPVWCAGRYRGVVSKIDALFAVSDSITEADVDSFVKMAGKVLSEPDPALALPAEQSWAAGTFGKVRRHSEKLRSSMAESLVLLAVHGNKLLQNRLGVDVEAHVTKLIKKLLSPLTTNVLRSHQDELSLYAEAAPETFLDLLDTDLKDRKPAVIDLMKSVDNGLLFVNANRVGLLRALERLAWFPSLLPRVARILARLSEVEIHDRIGNTPYSSLASILRGWKPQTAASLDDRVKCMEMIVKRFPAVGWRLCIAQIEQSNVYHVNVRPRLRPFPSVTHVSHDEIKRNLSTFQRTALDVVLGWPSYDEERIGDLVDLVAVMRDAGDRRRVWEIVDTFGRTATDRKRAYLHERISRSVFSAWGMRKVTDAIRSDARTALDKLVALDPVVRHRWLFANPGVAGFDDYTDGSEERTDWRRVADRVDRRRHDAMGEVWNSQGLPGVLKLLADSGAPEVIGRYVAPYAMKEGVAGDVLRGCLSSNEVADAKQDGFMCGFFAAMDDSERGGVLSRVADTVGSGHAARLFQCAPIGASTWKDLNRQPRHVIESYWRHVPIPASWPHTNAELNELLARLLDAKRPRVALYAAARSSWQHAETGFLKRLLDSIPDRYDGLHDRYSIRSNELSGALTELGKRVGITPPDMAVLEWKYLPHIVGLDEDRSHGIPNLERVVAEKPMLFVRAVALCSKRKDDGEDPPEWRIDDPEEARRAAHLLWCLRRIPGTDDDGVVHGERLQRWCKEVRELCAEHDRAALGDIYLGELFAHAPADTDDTWPCRPVCEVMERIGSFDLRRGFENGVYNARGAVWRGMEEGGDQERELAASWRSKAEKLAYDYPFVSTALEGIAKLYDGDAGEHDTEAQVTMRASW